MKTLWGAFVVEGASGNVYFAGDTGYWAHFKDAKEQFGPFELAILPIGAYEPRWFMRSIHMNPADAVQAHIDLKGQYMMPIHNGTFDLAFHAWFEPLERVKVAADRKAQTLHTPILGEVTSLNSTMTSTPWWQQFMPQKEMLALAP